MPLLIQPYSKYNSDIAIQHKDKDCPTKQESDVSTINSDPLPNKLGTLAEGLLELPRPIKQAVLLVGDYMVSIVCFWLYLLDANASHLLASLVQFRFFFYAVYLAMGLPTIFTRFITAPRR